MSKKAASRRVVLFLVALLGPSLVLVVLTVRTMDQERELADKRLQEERRRLVVDLRHSLSARLDRIRSGEILRLAEDASLPDEASDAILLAPVVDGRPVLPWELAQRPKQVVAEPETELFDRYVRQGEADEFSHGRYEEAARRYRLALRTSRSPFQSAEARLLLARVLAKMGRSRQAGEQCRHLLDLQLDLVDRIDIPFCLYAAERLLAAGDGLEEVQERLARDAVLPRWLSPPASHLLARIATRLIETTPDTSMRSEIQDVHRRAMRRVKFIEQSLALQAAFPTLGLPIPTSRTPIPTVARWLPYGTEPWFVNVVHGSEVAEAVLVAVPARPILLELERNHPSTTNRPFHIRFAFGDEAEGEAVGPNFPGLRVRIATQDAEQTRQWHSQRAFYLAALGLVLCVTLVGAYLLWRDVRRDVQLSVLRSQFVSSVSHELKTPLTSIRMFAETLRLRRSGESSMHTEYLDTIISESERLSRLLNNVLDFSKIERGDRHYHLEESSLSDTVTAAVRCVEEPLAQQGYHLDVSVDDDLPYVRADADALQQAILNLVANAVKFSGASRRIELHLRRQDREAVIEVVDYGLGIPSDEHARIFEKFYRVPSTAAANLPGTGLGLTIVEHVARAHGGRVSVRSEPGRGSTFSIHLPLDGHA